MKITKNELGLYKEPERNRFFTQSLFVETKQKASSWEPIFTLTGPDHTDDYQSLPKLYLEYEDLTEYTFAVGVLGSYEHWELLCEKTWFKPYVDRMRKELELFIKSKAISQIKRRANSGDLNANKYLASKGWRKDSLDTRTEEVGIKADDKQPVSVQKEKDRLQQIKKYEADLARMTQKKAL